MQTLTLIVRNVVVTVLIFSCLKLFIPSGELNRFVRLGGGVILLALIVIPAAEALGDVPPLRLTLPREEAVLNYAAQAEHITAVLENEATRIYEADAARDMAAFAASLPGITGAEAVLDTADDGSVEKLEISAKASVSAAEAERSLRAALARYLPEDRIAIIVKEE